MEETLRVHEELQWANEELQCALREKVLRVLKVSANPQPFTQAIMEEQVPPHYMVSKMAPYLRMGDLEVHLKTFRAQILIL